MRISIMGDGFKNILLLSMLAILLLPLSVTAQTADEVFADGQKFFNKGDYSRALKSFQEARRMGIKGPAIDYNLGVTQYKLKNYPESEQHFTRLLNDKGMRPLAAFNLGLVYDKQDKRSEAIKWFKVTYDESTDYKLKTLAWRALDELGVKVKKPFKRGMSGMVGLFYGSDSNVIDPVNPASNISDNFTELYAGLYYSISPSLQLNGFLLNQDYTIANTYDFQLMDLNLEKSFTRGSWDTNAAALFTTSSLGGLAYQDVVGGQIEGTRPLGKGHDLRLRYRYEQISSTARSYLQGTRQKLRVERISQDNRGNKLMYEMELNDRANSASASYSPTRHLLRYYVSHRISENWKTDGYVDYRISNYSPVAGVTREDQRMRLKARLKRKLGKQFELVGEYAYSNNQSNVASYVYSRNVVSLGVKAYY